MFAFVTLLTLVALGVVFDRLWTDQRGLRRAPRTAMPGLATAGGPAAPKAEGAFRAEIDRILRILDTGAGPKEAVVEVTDARPIAERPAPAVHAASSPAPESPVSPGVPETAARPVSRPAGPPDETGQSQAAPPVSRTDPARRSTSDLLAAVAAAPDDLPLIDDFDPTRDLLVIESDNADAAISWRGDGTGAATILTIDGIDRARVVAANGTFDAASVRLVAA